VRGSGRWRFVRRKLRDVAAVIATATPDSFSEAGIPRLIADRSLVRLLDGERL